MNSIGVFVQEVGTTLVDACMGCPLSLTLAVSAIRQAADAPPDADLMAAKYFDCWRAIRWDFRKQVVLTQALGIGFAEYERGVCDIYASSIVAVRHLFEGRGSPVPGATARTLDLLLQALRLLPPRRWIPSAAAIAIWRLLAETCPDDCGDAEMAEATLQLLAGYSIIVQETKSVYKWNGVHSQSLRIPLPSHVDCCITLLQDPLLRCFLPFSQH
jgi:hypothetical protein